MTISAMNKAQIIAELKTELHALTQFCDPIVVVIDFVFCLSRTSAEIVSVLPVETHR
jgi:hypothetical protein